MRACRNPESVADVMSGMPALPRSTFWRSLQTLSATRILIVLLLLLFLVFDGGASSPDGPNGHFIHGEECAVYLVLAVLFWLAALRWRHRFRWQLGAQVALDISFISLLYLDAGGLRSGIAILYLFPLAGAAVLAPLLLALFSASVVSLFILGDNLYRLLTGAPDRPLVLAGLYGAAFFAVVLVVSRMAAKLIRQEELALERGNALAIQQAINRLVIADMGDGILVAGRDGVVLTVNPAAQKMLGLATTASSFKLSDTPGLQPVAQAYDDWLKDPMRSAAFVTVKPYSAHMLNAQPGVLAAWSGRRDMAAHLKLRFATVDTSGLEAERSVIFLQDVTAIENQAQELKLASMGRLTASIAHEVRNPLSAIGHATGLLSEDLQLPVHVRLLKIVSDNVARVDRMVEDILKLSRKAQVQEAAMPLAPFLAELKAEFSELHALEDGVLTLADAGTAAVRFDPLHLREVLFNLLSNAVRYASGKPACIRIFVVRERSARMELHVQDDGAAISPDVRAHLFEPFYTTSSKGTGLGLYLARELCLNNGALLDYEYRFDAGASPGRQPSGRFVITFPATLEAPRAAQADLV
jgi:two-component system sensor histidine kinase PilS (NtrC family)